jgi:hypothetical protein
MAESGWPLIPREVLPAPVRSRSARSSRNTPGAQASQHPAGARAEAGRQLSIFGADTTEPSPADLAGLLAGPGRLGRMGGTARVSVRVDAAWRVHVLVAELVSRGLVVQWLPIEEGVRRDGAPPESAAPRDTGDDEPAVAGALPPGGSVGGSGDRPGAGVAAFEVRTAYSSRLNGLARAWPGAADQLFLSGPRLRLWVAAAGTPRDGGYALGLDPDKNLKTVDSALRRVGLPGSVSEDGRHYLIEGRKSLARLAELVGDRPSAAPGELWPDGAKA